jgi:MFS family permease
VVNNIPALAAIRFILGVVEAAVMPAMLIYISNWFTNLNAPAQHLPDPR